MVSESPVQSTRSETGERPGASQVPPRKRSSVAMHTHPGSLVGSQGRHAFADFMRPNSDSVRTMLDIDGSNSAIADGDGPVLDSGVLAPGETQRLLHEREELLRDNHIKIPGQSQSQSYGSVGDSGGLHRTITPDAACAIDTAWDEAAAQRLIKTNVGRELVVLAVNTAPLAVTFFLQYALVVASIFSVGHLGKIELGAVSVGTMTASITGFALIQGMATCLDTLCAQAYGAGRLDLVGVYFQKCVVMTLVLFLPVLMLWLHCETVLKYILASGQEELVVLASQYLRIVALGIPGYTLFECGKRFLQAQGIYHASTMVLMICTPINIFLNYSFVWNSKFGIGFSGAPLAVACTDWLMAIMLGLYVVFIDGKAAWNGLSWSVFTGWGPLIRLAIPGVIMVESEFLAFEALTLASSHLGTTALAAQIVLSSITSLAYQVPFALSIATSTRVANFVGAGLKYPAKLTSEVSLAASLVLSLIVAMIIYLTRYYSTALFSNDEGVIAYSVKAIPMCAILHIFDGMQSVLGGILRGQGRQRIGSILGLICYYVIGIPLALLFAFTFKMGLEGLWGGVTLAVFAICVVSTHLVARTNWERVIEQSKQYLA